jgi:hypothetical protein
MMEPDPGVGADPDFEKKNTGSSEHHGGLARRQNDQARPTELAGAHFLHRPADYESGFAFPGTFTVVYSCRSEACLDGCIFPWRRMDCNSDCNYPRLKDGRADS